MAKRTEICKKQKTTSATKKNTETDALPLNDDWQLGRGLGDCLLGLFQQGLLTDVTFTFQEDDATVRVKTHRLVLISRSPVFQAMFCGPMADSSDEIKITDITAATFRLLLTYMYSDDVSLTEDEAMDLMYPAHKYRMTTLFSHCADVLSGLVSIENVFAILENAMLLEDKPLVTKCFNFIDDNASNVLISDNFRKLTLPILKTILNGDFLFVNEVEIFNAVMTWAEAECLRQDLEPSGAHIRTVIGEAFMSIRFPSMKSPDFANNILNRYVNLFKLEEEVLIYRQKWSKGEIQGDSSNELFAAKPRKKRVKAICPDQPDFLTYVNKPDLTTVVGIVTSTDTYLTDIYLSRSIYLTLPPSCKQLMSSSYNASRTRNLYHVSNQQSCSNMYGKVRGHVEIQGMQDNPFSLCLDSQTKRVHLQHRVYFKKGESRSLTLKLRGVGSHVADATQPYHLVVPRLDKPLDSILDPVATITFCDKEAAFAGCTFEAVSNR